MDVSKWVGELTAAGFDIVGANGHTSRGDWNSNHPMPSITLHMRREKDARDVVLKTYAVNGRHWTTYATMFKGKAKNRHFGFDVVGTKEVSLEFDTIEEQVA